MLVRDGVGVDVVGVGVGCVGGFVGLVFLE